MAEVRVGISGWRYREWRGAFYPVGLRQAGELAYAAAQFDSLEINGSFYSLQRPSSFEAWRAQTPDDFVMAVKGGRFITHMKKLRDVRQALANFFASGLLALEHKLGPVLWQFPENMPADMARFEAFLQLLPEDSSAAERLARDHADWMEGRSLTHASGRWRIRHAFELRNPACATPEFIALLRRHGVALVIADTAGRFPFVEDITADFVYVRLHGDTQLYASAYGDQALAHWARRILLWHSGREPSDAPRIAPPLAASGPRDVYVYFDNDMHAHAPRDALALRRMLDRQPRLHMARRRLRPGARPCISTEGQMAAKKKASKRKYGAKSKSLVAKKMRQRKKGTLKSGRSKKKVTSRKQAIAIALSEARKSGAKVPKRKSAKRKR